MKTTLQLLCVVMLCFFYNHASAQLPNGSIAPDWTLTDINGTTYNLYDELEAGKSIVLDISATWCPPCWSYHQSGILEDLYEDFGPDGTDQIRVFMVEGDSDTNLACLYGSAGCNDATMGNWVTGVNYPIFSPGPAAADQFINDYQLGYWPTLYGISPLDNTTRLINQASYSVWESWLIASWQMSATFTTADADCPYQGMIDLQMENGFGSLDYEWSNGAQTEDLINIPAGIYSVTVTDAHNVEFVMDNIVVGGSTAAALAVQQQSVTDVQCSGDATGSLSVNAIGGSGAFTYTWSNGLTGNSVTNLTAGDYEVICTDANGCSVMQVFSVDEPQALVSGSSPIATTCGEDNGFAFVFGSGGTTPYSYDIGYGPLISGSFPSLAAGDYEVIITDANGCNSTEFFTIDPSELPVAQVTGDNIIDCTNSELELSASSSTYAGNASFQWTTSDGTIVGANSGSTIKVSAAGTYDLLLVELLSGCAVETSFVVTENINIPTATIAEASAIDCNNTLSILDGSMSEFGDNIIYEWTTIDGNIISESNANTIEVDQAGTYNLIVTNTTTGCSGMTFQTVQADTELPTIAVNDGMITCNAAEVQICANVSDGHEVVWTTATGEIEETCIIVNSAGEYQATVIAPNGCTNVATAIIEASTDIPQVDIAVPSMITCLQSEVNISATVSGDLDSQILTWTDADGLVIGENTTDISVSNAGTYELTVTNDLGCIAVTQVLVEENTEVPNIEVNDGTLTCTNTSVEICATVDVDHVVVWTNESTTIIANCLNVEMPGQYMATVTAPNGCTTTAVATIDQFLDTPLALFDYNIDGDGVVSFMNLSPTTGIVTYTLPDGSVVEGSDATFNFDGPGTVEVCMTITNDCGSDQSCQEISFGGALVMTVQKTDLSCFESNDGSAMAFVTGGVADYIYFWIGPDGFTSEAASISDVAAGLYTLTVIDANQTEVTSDVTITQPQEIVLESSSVADDIDNNSNGQINMIISGGTGTFTYEWSNGSTVANPDNLKGGDYTVIVTDERGCSKEFGPFTVNSVVAINELDFISNFSMYPVPAYTVLHVEAKLNSTKSVKVNIQDLTGRMIWTNTYNTSDIRESIDLAYYNSGIYTIQFISGDKIQSEKFIVVK